MRVGDYLFCYTSIMVILSYVTQCEECKHFVLNVMYLRIKNIVCFQYWFDHVI